jgi:RNA polymerase sigma-70 factor (ECF subfamily)
MLRGISDLDLKRRLIEAAGPLWTYLDSKIPRSLRPGLQPDDVLQEVWITAFRRLKTKDAVEVHTFNAWLLSIANQRLLDALRLHRSVKRGGRERIQQAAQTSSLLGLFRSMASPQKSPSKVVRDRETIDDLRNVIASLPERERQVVWMRYVEGQSWDSIAEAMQCTVPMIRGLLARGKKRMRNEMQDAARFLSDVHSAVVQVQASRR